MNNVSWHKTYVSSNVSVSQQKYMGYELRGGGGVGVCVCVWGGGGGGMF